MLSSGTRSRPLPPETLEMAQVRRREMALELSPNGSLLLSNADRVGPEARHRLAGLIKYYAKKPHPFRACVSDNTKRFGEDRAKRVCAVIKDIRGTTKWRGNPELDHGAPGAVGLDDATEELITPEIAGLLCTLTAKDLKNLAVLLEQEM